MEHSTIDHGRLTLLLAAPLASEEPVVSIYLSTGGTTAERRVVLKNLLKQGEEAIRRDTGFDDERRKTAQGALSRAHGAVDEALGRGHPRGTFVAFAWSERLETFRIPVTLKDRVVVDRTPYTSPLSTVLEQYERYAVLLVDHKHGRIFESFMGVLREVEDLIDPPGPKHTAGNLGLEQARANHHADYVLHRHLERVADRLFNHHKRGAFDKLVIAGQSDVLTKLERCLHPYLKQRIAAREHWSADLPRDDVRKRIVELEAQIEAAKERKTLALVRDHVCGDLLATTGFDETLKALYYGKVAVLVVEDSGTARCGRECPDCHYLFPRPEDAKATSPVMIPCPFCERPTRVVPDIVDEAVEVAILTGAKVEHVHSAKDELAALGGIASVLRFR